MGSSDSISRKPNTPTLYLCTYIFRKKKKTFDHLFVVFLFTYLFFIETGSHWQPRLIWNFWSSNSQLLKLKSQTFITIPSYICHISKYSLQYNELWSHLFPISHLQFPRPLNPHSIFMSLSLYSHCVQVVWLICAWVSIEPSTVAHISAHNPKEKWLSIPQLPSIASGSWAKEGLVSPPPSLMELLFDLVQVLCG